MRILFSSLIVFLISCQSNKREKENITETHTINPWEYINRISDTLPETNFSLFNNIEKNKELLGKYKLDRLFFKYRVGQNRYITVKSSAILNFYVCILYGYGPIFMGLNFNDEFILDYEYFADINTNASDTICKKMLEFVSETENEYPFIPFYFNFSHGTKQSSILKFYDQLADGYLKFLNVVSMNRHKIKFIELKESQQNEIIKDYPLIMEYDFHRLQIRVSPPPAPSSGG